MPFLSVLLDRYTSAKAKGRSDFDWSAIGLSVAEDAGIDVSDDVARTRKDIDEGNLYYFRFLLIKMMLHATTKVSRS